MPKYGHPSRPVVSAGTVIKDAIDGAIDYLSNSNNITLVLGAGTSVFYELPTWDTLLFELFKITRKGKVKGDNLKLEYQILKMNYDNPSLAQYITEDPKVRDITILCESLYKSFLSLPSTVSPLHNEIISLAKRTKNLNIITYNFDGLLEYYLKKEGVPFNLSYGDTIDYKVDATNIFHVHGYLPVDSKVSKEVALTFSESQYIKQYNNVYSWQNQIQLSHFSNNPCIFIGLSFTDPNMKKLLTTRIMKEGVKHYKLDVPFDLTSLTKIQNEHFKNLKPDNKKLPDTVKLINDSRLELCNKLGIDLLNFNKHDEFSGFISKIT